MPGDHGEGQVGAHRHRHLAGDSVLFLFREALPVLGVGEVHVVSRPVHEQLVGEGVVAPQEVLVALAREIGRPVGGDADVHDVDVAPPAGVGDAVLLREPHVVPVGSELGAGPGGSEDRARIGSIPNAGAEVHSLGHQLAGGPSQALVGDQSASGCPERQQNQYQRRPHPCLTPALHVFQTLSLPADRRNSSCVTPDAEECAKIGSHYKP